MADETPWQWWAGASDERYTVGPCATKEEIIEEAKRQHLHEEPDYGPGFHIVEGTHKLHDLSTLVDIDDIRNAWDEVLDEFDDPDSFDSVFEGKVTPAQWQELEGILQKEVRDWQARHGIVIRPWMFDQQRNEEYIDLSKEDVDGEV